MDGIFYHGTRGTWAPASEVEGATGDVRFSPDLDAAIWDAELVEGDGVPRVYQVTPTGPVENLADNAAYRPKPHPHMTWRADGPLVVAHEVIEWTHYHGTRAALAPGDLISAGHAANFGPAPRTSNLVYFARTLDAAIWGAELAAGDGPAHIYRVEPTGPYEDDPNVTDAKFRGNPTKSFRSPAPLRVVGEFTEWKGHPPELVAHMKASVATMERAGVAPDDG